MITKNRFKAVPNGTRTGTSSVVDVVTGKVVALGAANEPEIPSVLSTKFGGPFVTQTGAGGEESAEPVYHATVILDELRLPVQSGMRGTGRFTRSAMTVGSWLTEEFHRLFVVR